MKDFADRRMLLQLSMKLSENQKIELMLTLRNSKDVPTRKFAVQFVAAATEFAAPRAPDVKSSETKNHGMEPAKNFQVGQFINKQFISNVEASVIVNVDAAFARI